MSTDNKKVRGVALVAIAVILLFAFLGLLNGRYQYIGEDNLGCIMFDKWKCDVVYIDYYEE